MEGFPGGSDGKESAFNARDLGSVPGLGRYPGEGNETHFNILALKIPWIKYYFVCILLSILLSFKSH